MIETSIFLGADEETHRHRDVLQLVYVHLSVNGGHRNATYWRMAIHAQNTIGKRNNTIARIKRNCIIILNIIYTAKPPKSRIVKVNYITKILY